MGCYLETLGKLDIIGQMHVRPSPLILLSYLALEGTKDREYLADLFFLETARPRANLRKALYRLNQQEQLVEKRANGLTTSVVSDAERLQEAAQQGLWSRVTQLYGGPFLAGTSLNHLPAELREWVYKKRESLEICVFDAYLTLIRRALQNDELSVASALLNQGLGVIDIHQLEPPQLKQCYKLACDLRSYKLRDICALVRDYDRRLAA